MYASSCDQFKKAEMGGTCDTHGRDGKYNIFVGKSEGKRPLGRHRRRWEDNIRMDLLETGWEIVDCMHLTQYRDQWWAL
jgi:hypothetical protein